MWLGRESCIVTICTSHLYRNIVLVLIYSYSLSRALTFVSGDRPVGYHQNKLVHLQKTSFQCQYPRGGVGGALAIKWLVCTICSAEVRAFPRLVIVREMPFTNTRVCEVQADELIIIMTLGCSIMACSPHTVQYTTQICKWWYP